MHKRAKSNWLVALAILIAGCLGLGIWWWVYQYSLTHTDTPPMIEALGTAGLGLAFGGVLGGVIKVLFDAWTDRRAAQAADYTFYNQLLNDFKSVYDTVERARFLIDAHKSAKTYGEQMRNIPDTIITLHNVRRAIQQGYPKLAKELDAPIRACIAFLKGLTKEYRVHYLEASRLQSQDEVINKISREIFADDLMQSAEWQYPDTAAMHAEKPKMAQLSDTGWQRLMNLPCLGILLTATQDENLSEEEAEAAFKPYKDKFVQHIDQASLCLMRQLPNGARGAPSLS